jgi:hypothetical protein
MASLMGAMLVRQRTSRKKIVPLREGVGEEMEIKRLHRNETPERIQDLPHAG